MMGGQAWMSAALLALAVTTAAGDEKNKHPIHHEELPVVPLDQVVTAYHDPEGMALVETIREAEAGGPARPALSKISSARPHRLGHAPYMVAMLITLETGELSVCNGILFTEERFMTAASCFWDGVTRVHDILAVFGSTTLFSGGARRYVHKATLHSLYTPASQLHNSALLTVAKFEIFPSPYVNQIELVPTAEPVQKLPVQLHTFGYFAECKCGGIIITLGTVFAGYPCGDGAGRAAPLCVRNAMAAPCGAPPGAALTVTVGGTERLIGMYVGQKKDSQECTIDPDSSLYLGVSGLLKI